MPTPPTHHAFIVEERENDKPFWREVAPAWAHKNGKGLDLIISCRHGAHHKNKTGPWPSYL